MSYFRIWPVWGVSEPPAPSRLPLVESDSRPYRGALLTKTSSETF